MKVFDMGRNLDRFKNIEAVFDRLLPPVGHIPLETRVLTLEKEVASIKALLEKRR